MSKNKIVFYLIYPFLFLISNIPLNILYFIANIIYWFVYYIIGYRKKTVRKNLKLAFPEKSDAERLAIEKKSFRHFVDIFIEMIKGFTISKAQINKRYKYTNPEIFKELEALNKSVILMGAHHGNWEWLFNINEFTSLQCYGAYKRVSNTYFDNYVQQNRSRFGSHFIATDETIPQITKNYRKGIPSIYGLLSDQTPALAKTHYWSKFFGHEVPIHTGAEMLAKRFNFAVIFMNITMPKRGYYEIEFEILSTNPAKTEEYPITEIYLQKTEAMIQKHPEIYFWTHKRFKHLNKKPITA